MIDTLKKCGATHLVWLPDTESGYLYKSLSEDPDLTLVPVTREGETFAIALGLLVGGKKPVVCIQNTGLFASEDSAATFLEPILNAWGIPYEVVENDQQVQDVVPKMYKQSGERPGPAAV